MVAKFCVSGNVLLDTLTQNLMSTFAELADNILPKYFHRKIMPCVGVGLVYIFCTYLPNKLKSDVKYSLSEVYFGLHMGVWFCGNKMNNRTRVVKLLVCA